VHFGFSEWIVVDYYRWRESYYLFQVDLLYVLRVLLSSVQERKSIRPNISADGIYGGALLAVRSSECVCFYDWVECRLIRRIDVVAKVEDSDALLCDSPCTL
jgi:hypothetical protein